MRPQGTLFRSVSQLIALFPLFQVLSSHIPRKMFLHVIMTMRAYRRCVHDTLFPIFSSLLCLCMTVVIVFQVSELLSKKGAEVALLRLKQSGFTRSSCLLFFALSLISCLIGNTSNVVRTISAIGIAITLGALIIYFIIERAEFQELFPNDTDAADDKACLTNSRL